MKHMTVSERKLALALIVPDDEPYRGGRRSRVPVKRAQALYDMLGTWGRVAFVLGFKENSVTKAVRRHERRP